MMRVVLFREYILFIWLVVEYLTLINKSIVNSRTNIKYLICSNVHSSLKTFTRGENKLKKTSFITKNGKTMYEHEDIVCYVALWLKGLLL